ADDEGAIEGTGSDGVMRLHVFKTLAATPASDIAVLISIPTAVAFADVDRRLFGSLAVWGLVTLFAFSAAWLGGGIFVIGPIKALLDVTQRLRSGDLSARNALQYGVQELSQLSRTFHEMSA